MAAVKQVSVKIVPMQRKGQESMAESVRSQWV